LGANAKGEIMGTVFKKTATKPLPKGATIIVRKGQRLVAIEGLPLESKWVANREIAAVRHLLLRSKSLRDQSQPSTTSPNHQGSYIGGKSKAVCWERGLRKSSSGLRTGEDKARVNGRFGRIGRTRRFSRYFLR
jgi:hypothetical protein